MTTSNAAGVGSSSWTGMVPVQDTTLAVTDTGGPGVPVIYLNGHFASQRHWRRVTAELGAGFRHITYDMRSRGRSPRAADNSFQSHLHDVDAILDARGVDRPVVVGWSYGAAVAVHWASQNPGRVRGVVPVDGAFPYDWRSPEMDERIRVMFHRMRFLLPLVRPFGLAARMSADEHGRSNMELNEILARIGPILEAASYPVRFVVASGGNLGGVAEDMERMRASLQPVLARNPNVTMSAKVPSNHGSILRKDFLAVADAVRGLAAGRSSY